MSDNLKPVWIRKGKRRIKKSCRSCEFNCGDVCAGDGIRTDNGELTYGMPMKEAYEMFPNGCRDYGISLEAFIKLNYAL